MARQRRSAWRDAALVMLGGIAAGLLWAALPEGTLPEPAAARAPAETVTARFVLCRGPARDTCVVDGDTFWLEGTKIRIADIDTPEVLSPECDAEAALGRRATQRLRALLNAGPIALVPIDRETDRYGRTLRVVERDGVSLGETLVAEGLAHRWGSGRRGWC